MIYNVITLGLRPNMLGAVLPQLHGAITEGLPHGRLLGCFACEFGVLNRFVVLCAYEDADALAKDRAGIVAAGNPLGLAQYLNAFEQAAYTQFSFAKPIEPGSYGPFYEIRTYGVAAGGLPEISDAWSKVIERRTTMSPLLTVMGSLDTAPQRMMHIWPYKALADRSAARGQASKEGIWPPAGGSAPILSMQSELFVATAFSPLA